MYSKQSFASHFINRAGSDPKINKIDHIVKEKQVNKELKS